ncbi:glycoside hydrolase family 3 N-terminal domain-containing protein [Pedobacter glucosidilyticus]|uniref:glycoside hydrolase family 3 N-terminal domain-containing protein n=1 Tax=Pedobacter glucosidilyticus TaxID=1122941 RepID=UPI000422F90B|nr:glycoside hydrolase family 3 N-terminal domain-containing protein [Pedobacter glucosidilyticus]
MMNRKPFLALFAVTTILVSFTNPIKIYKKDWIDLNKNGKKDIYEDKTRSIDERVDNLLSQMNLNEKTNQMATLYGWKRILKDSLPTANWKNEIWKDGIANIDEHLNGFLNWNSVETKLDLVTDIKRHVWAMNETQRFFIEQTRLGIPVDFTNEGIRGIEAYEATGFPTQLNMGMTWNPSLVHQMGVITGKEARALGYTNVYAPILDVARDQRWGRLEEVYGEDPYLTARLGVEMANGIQSAGAASTPKHFAVYSANKGAREGLARTDPQVSPREVEDILLYPFRKVIKEANIMGVMSSYNDYNGIPVSGSKYWLIDRLRTDMGFTGYVVSDSDALEYLYNKHHVAANLKEAVYQAFMAGMNVRTTFRAPDSIIYALRELVQEGRIPMDTINSRVKDVLRVKFKLGLFDEPYVKNAEESAKLVNNLNHQNVALQASKESLVLLKNSNNALPISKKLSSVAVIGPNAKDNDYAHTHYGPLKSASVTILEGIQNKIGKAKVLYAEGSALIDQNWPESEIFPEAPNAEEQAAIDFAVKQAQKAELTILVLGGNTKTAGENKSRTSLDLPGHQMALAKAIHATGKPYVVVLTGSQPMTINWLDRYAPAIVYAGYPGVKGGLAVADVLFGDYNPGGKLTLTFPKSVGQLPLNFPTKPNAQTDEGESARVKGLLYPFGYGLSYTTFKYSNIKIDNQLATKDEVMVSVDITNTGTLAGDEVVQLYTRDLLSTVTTYEKNLRGFQRVTLNPGETKKLVFKLVSDDLMLWNRDMKRVVEPGDFKVMLGSSSEDIRQSAVFTVK